MIKEASRMKLRLQKKFSGKSHQFVRSNFENTEWWRSGPYQQQLYIITVMDNPGKTGSHRAYRIHTKLKVSNANTNLSGH